MNKQQTPSIVKTKTGHIKRLTTPGKIRNAMLKMPGIVSCEYLPDDRIKGNYFFIKRDGENKRFGVSFNPEVYNWKYVQFKGVKFMDLA